eukprot:SAG11_NODE_23371_length_390_cov_0.470790_1_plen_100_part_00
MAQDSDADTITMVRVMHMINTTSEFRLPSWSFIGRRGSRENRKGYGAKHERTGYVAAVRLCGWAAVRLCPVLLPPPAAAESPPHHSLFGLTPLIVYSVR